MIKIIFGQMLLIVAKNLICGQRKRFWSLIHYLIFKYMLFLHSDGSLGMVHVHIRLSSANSINFDELSVTFARHFTFLSKMFRRIFLLV